MTTLILKTPSALASGGLGHYKDAALADGVEFLFDLGSVAGWPSQAAPLITDPVPDVSGNGNGEMAITSGQTLAFAGGGFDFAGVTADNEVIKAPACLSAIHAGLQYFMVASWLKLPVQADWSTSAFIAPFFCTTDTEGGYSSTEADLLTLAQSSSSGGSLTARRQTALGTVEQTSLVMPTGYFGLVSQVAFWRNASGVGLRIKSSAGTLVATGAASVANAADFSAKRPQWGVTKSWFDPSGARPNHEDAVNFRLYRGWIEDLAASGRDPVTVLDADYARTVARDVYS